MPLGNPHPIPQPAVDVALYVDAQERPAFVLAEHLPEGLKANEYNATLRAETDTVDSNLRKLRLSLQGIKRWLTCDLALVRAGSFLRYFDQMATPGLITFQIRPTENV